MMTYKTEEEAKASSISIILTTTAAAAVNCKVFSGSAFIHSLTLIHSAVNFLPLSLSTCPTQKKTQW